MADLTTLLSKFLQNLSFYSGGVSGALTVNTTQTGTTAVTTEEDLWTYSLPANTLSANGKTLRITVFFKHATNGNDKLKKLYFGSTVIAQHQGTQSAISGIIQATLVRTSATAQLAWNVVVGPGNAAVTSQPAIETTPAETLSGAVTIKFTGQNGTASANDIVFRAAIVELLN
jgi:hypothetical protein